MYTRPPHPLLSSLPLLIENISYQYFALKLPWPDSLRNGILNAGQIGYLKSIFVEVFSKHTFCYVCIKRILPILADVLSKQTFSYVCIKRILPILAEVLSKQTFCSVCIKRILPILADF